MCNFICPHCKCFLVPGVYITLCFSFYSQPDENMRFLISSPAFQLNIVQPFTLSWSFLHLIHHLAVFFFFVNSFFFLAWVFLSTELRESLSRKSRLPKLHATINMKLMCHLFAFRFNCWIFIHNVVWKIFFSCLLPLCTVIFLIYWWSCCLGEWAPRAEQSSFFPPDLIKWMSKPIRNTEHFKSNNYSIYTIQQREMRSIHA